MVIKKLSKQNFNPRRLYCKLCIIAIISFINLFLSDVYSQTTTIAIAGKEYLRSGFHNIFWGKHYRKEWGTPVTVNNFYLDSNFGGLQPLKISGSRQTTGLRLKNSIGKEYVLRSIDKDFGNGFPDIYAGTFISRVAKDQTSFDYPFAAITITPMIDAAKIYHTNPQIVFVPKQSALGEFNEKYGDQMYLIEERADEDQSDAPWFGNSAKVISTSKLYEKILEDNDKSVDQFSFAKARLFDMFIGDWGRHADQWRWASFENDDKTIYRPIPRDRDQAYSKFDGFYPYLITHFVGARHLESFSGNIKNISSFNKPAYLLDQQFTNQLPESEWVRAARELQQVLTDSLIDYSMHLLPPEIYEINGVTITNHLKSRRDHLQNFAHDYYKFLAKQIPVYGSDKRELFDINRINDIETIIKVFKIKKDGSVEAEPFYSRTISKEETKVIHLYGFNESDVYKFSGDGTDGIKLRVIGFTKDDSLIMQPNHRDRKIQVYKGSNELYDTTFQRRIKISPIIIASPKIYGVFENDALGLFTRPGVHVGLSLAYHPAPWKKYSLETIHYIAVNYGVLRKTFYVDYVGLFPKVKDNWDFLIKAKFDNPAAENYFGIGNETVDSADVSATYYNVFSTRYFAGIGIAKNIKKTHFFDLTFFFQNIKVKENAGHYIEQKEKTLPVYDNQSYTGLEAGYHYSNTNSELLATKGINFYASGGYFMNVGNTNDLFFKGLSNVAVYVPLGKIISFAVRAGGATVSGNPNYYHLSKLGGNVNLRGFARERFYGKTSFYNNNEVRFITNTHNFLFNGKIGVFGFYDDGRVWQPGEISNTWHVGYGAGLVVVPFNKVALTATYGKSIEGTQILLKASMFF